ncbi:MAG: hypothetical protein ACJ76F_09225 [Bacteroidia bacterium]
MNNTIQRNKKLKCMSLALITLLLALGCRSRKDLHKTSVGPLLDTALIVHAENATEKKSEFPEKDTVFLVSAIRVMVLDPLGRDIKDTGRYKRTLVTTTVDRLHFKTRERIIRNFLLFKEKDTISSMELKESERLLRKNLRIRDARIIATPDSSVENASEITVIVQDLVSLNLGITDLNNLSTYTIADRNFLGTGSIVQAGAAFYKKEYNSASLYLNYPSLKRSYVNLSFSYSTADSNFTKGLQLNRDFSSGLFRWAGGASYLLRNNNRYFYTGTGISGGYNSSAKQLDLWGGHAFRIGAQQNNGAIKNLVLNVRYVNVLENISHIIQRGDSVFPILNKSGNKYLLAFGMNKRRYYKDSYIFRFGYSEDIPEGYMASLMIGSTVNMNYSTGLYTGISAGIANTNRAGYWNLSGQYIKTFSAYKATAVETGSIKLFYLSPLLLNSRFKDRIILNARSQRISSDIVFDRLILNNEDGFLNINSRLLSGLTKVSLLLNNIVYTPYKPLGFNVGFFGYAAFANLTRVRDFSITKNWYQAYGLGILLRNEHLLINSIRLAITYYPSFPESTYRFNPLWIYELQIPDMAINRPEYELN